MIIEKLVEEQRTFFGTGATRPYEWRMDSLSKLEDEIRRMESEINDALKKDINKAPLESYMTEVGMTLAEISYIKKHLRAWMKEKKVLTPLVQFPSKSFTIAEPYGVTLIMSPWNYPFMLCMEPLVGAIAAGNCSILKPSAYSKATSEVISKLVANIYPPEYIAVVEGGREANTELLDQRFDYIFFTGGVGVGKLVMEKASHNLTPVSLELGGKSPCIIDETANIPVAAKRLVFGKFLNSGQTCVAPDYVLVHESVEADLISEIQRQIKEMYSDNPLQNDAYPKMINEKHFNRVCGLIDKNKVTVGGQSDINTLKIEPTVLRGVTTKDAVMQEEIFGPVLPIIHYSNKNDILNVVGSYEKPLALYLFTTSKAMEHWTLSHISFGGGCINDTIIHLATSRMGFGGVGGSGMGSYHGQLSFETFSHRKSIVKKANWLDLPFRYQPYTETKSKLIRFFMK